MTPDAKRALNYLAGYPPGHTTLLRKDTTELLIETGGNMLACGSLYNFKVVDIGADVCRISLELANP